MNTQQKKLLAIVAVVMFHGAVITVMLAQHGCKSNESQPSAIDSPAPPQPAPVAAVTPPSNTLTSSNNGFVEPTRPPPETPVTPVAVAQFSEPLPTITPLPAPIIPQAPAPVAPPTAAAPMTVTWVVSKGDSLALIARKNSITVDELVAANAPKITRTTTLQPGQSINVPSHKPTATSVAPMAADSANTYKVASGDSMGKIATKFHTTVKALQELNGMTSTALRAGQVLKVPEAPTGASPGASTPAHVAATVASTEGTTYTVKSGDSLDKISHTVHVSVSELKTLNGLTDTTARNLRPGQTLKLPSGTALSAPTVPASTTLSAPPPISVTVGPASSLPPPVTMPVMAVPTSSSGTAPPITPVN